MGRCIKHALVGVLVGVWAIAGLAAEVVKAPVAKESIGVVDLQVQAIKKNILSISAELAQMEEKLLFPSNTQLTLFLSLAQGDKFHLDAITVNLDGKTATHYIYTHKELEALQHGGVQRLYSGNIQTGEHTLDIAVIGKASAVSNYQHKANYNFSKGVTGPKIIEVVLSRTGSRFRSVAD